MRKNINRGLLFLLCILVSLSFVSCNHVSNYSATIMITSNENHTLSIRFDSLNGRIWKNFRKSADGEGMLAYSASLEEGKLSVSYEAADGSLCPLFSIRGGESISDQGGYIEGRAEKRIHIVIETNGKCKGGKLEIKFSKGEEA